MQNETAKQQDSLILAIADALRVTQWVKNLLVFVPLAVSHNVTQLPLLGFNVLAFIAFSFCASAGYIFNDLLDLEADRQHSRKKFRPFALGTLSVKAGIVLAGILILSAFAIAIFLPPLFAVSLVLYLVTTAAYSLKLKKIASVDIMTLAGLYTLRVLAGGIAVDIFPSVWLLAFSVFLFLSLAIIKRYAELLALQKDGQEAANRRGYSVADLDILRSAGTASGYLSVLVLVLYINSPEVRLLYKRPSILLLVGFLLLYWVTRLWILTHRGKITDDPLIFTFQDSRSYLVGAIVALIVIIATL